MADFVPPKRNDRREWLDNISKNVVAEVTKMGADAGDGTAVKALADELIAAYDATDAAQTALDGKRAIETEKEDANIRAIRKFISNWKTLADYPTSGSEGVLKLKSSGTVFDPNTYKPVIKVSIKGGQLVIDFQKKGVDAMAIYCRLRGTNAWTKLGIDVFPPYTDTMPLHNPGVAEVREYMARGVIDDIEIGLESDIVSITFGG